MAQQDIETLTGHLIDTFSEAKPDLTIIFDNQPEEEPDEGNIWCRFYVRPSEENVTTIGDNRRFETIGIATLQIIAPAQTGSGDAWDIAEIYMDSFREWRSPDRALSVYRFAQQVVPEQGKYVLKVLAYWRSIHIA